MNAWFDFDAAAAEGQIDENTQMQGIIMSGAEPASASPVAYVTSPRLYPSVIQTRPRFDVGWFRVGEIGLGVGPATYPLPHAATTLPIAATTQPRRMTVRKPIGKALNSANPATYPGFGLIGSAMMEGDQGKNGGDQDDAGTRSKGLEMAAAFQWRPDIATVEDVKKHLNGDDALHLKIMVEDDDFQEVEEEAQKYAELIFKAILTKPDQMPTNVSLRNTPHGEEQQSTYLERCQDLMECNNGIKDACARALLIVDEAVHLHRDRITIRQLDKDSAKRMMEDYKKVLRPNSPAVKTNVESFATPPIPPRQ